MLKAAGVSDFIALEIVGHESAAVSRQYTHLTTDDKRAAMRRRLPEVTSGSGSGAPLAYFFERAFLPAQMPLKCRLKRLARFRRFTLRLILVLQSLASRLSAREKEPGLFCSEANAGDRSIV